MYRTALSILSVAGLLLSTACGQGPDSSATSTSSKSGSASTAVAKTVSPDSSGTCHEVLTANDGVTQIDFDYQPQPGTTQTTASATLSVVNPSFTGSETVTATILTWSYAGKGNASNALYNASMDQTFNLTWDGTSAFTAQAPQAVALSYDDDQPASDVTYYLFEFAVTVNGVNLVDPVSSSNNFLYTPNDQGSGICDGSGV